MKVEHTVHRLFPIPLFQFQIEDDEFNERQLNLLKEQDFEMRTEGRVHTTLGDLHTKPRFAELNTMLRNCLEHMRETYRYECKEFEVNSMWGNITYPGDSHHHHFHPNAFLSGVYTPGPINSPVMFRDPNMQLRQSAISVTNERGDNDDLFGLARSAPQDKGSVFIFPWYLLHQVAENPGPDPRYSIAFNVVPRGPIGSLETLTYLHL